MCYNYIQGNDMTENAQEKSAMPSVDRVLTSKEDRLEEAKKKAFNGIVKRLLDKGIPKEEAEKRAAVELNEMIDKAKAQSNASISEFNIDLLNLYREEPFLGTVSMSVTKRLDFVAKTAYMAVKSVSNRYELMLGLNPDFFRALSPKQRRGVLMHELYHLIFQHLFSRAPGDKHYATLWNWATDLAINTIIGEENLPDMCLIPGKANIDSDTGKEITGPYHDFIKNAPLMKSSDYYFEELRKIEEEESKNGNGNSIEIAISAGMGTMDDHGKWDEIPQEVREQIEQATRGILENAARRASQNDSWGSIPSEIQEVINKLLSHEIDWRAILRQFIGRCRTMDRNSTIKRINKKVPYLLPGYVRKYEANFACFIDQSGSMSDDDISMLFSELEGFAQQTEIEVFHFDTEIDLKSRTKWKKSQPFPQAHRTRCGGTDFQAVADFCNLPENRGHWAGVVILTDGYAPKMGQIIGSRTIWVITEGGDMNAVRSGDLAIQMKHAEEGFKRY